MRRACLPALALIAGFTLPPSLAAQGEHAIPMRGGSFRFSFGAEWAHFTERFGAPTPLNPTLPNGTREPIGLYFGAESLGVSQLTFLTPIQDQIRTITGVNAYALNIGRTRLTLDASVRHQPLRLAFAPSSKIGFQVSVPIVRARMSAFLAGGDTSAGTTLANVGSMDPAIAAAFRTQADAALIALQTQATSGPIALRAQAQAQLDAMRPLVCGLTTLTTTSGADAASPCFGGLAPVPFMPLDTSEAGDSIIARLGRARSSYSTLATQYGVAGVTMPAFTALFTLPGTSLDSGAVRSLLRDVSAIGGDSLAEVVRTGIGDIEVGGWLQLLNNPGWRSQVAVLVRLPTGKMDAPGNLIDIGTGDHQTDIEVAFRNDLVLSRNLWIHAGGRYGIQMKDVLTRRVTPYYLPYAPAANDAEVNRDLGDYLQIDVSPNWQIDDSFGVGFGWHFYRRGATAYSYVDPADEARIGLPASVLGLETAETRMRIGAGATFSTLERYAAGRARLPYRVTWSYNSTFIGRGGLTPKAGIMRIEIQAFFGNLR